MAKFTIGLTLQTLLIISAGLCVNAAAYGAAVMFALSALTSANFISAFIVAELRGNNG